MMERRACFERIAELRGDAVVVATYSSAFEWHRVDPNPLNFVSVGAMGQASSHALGLALGMPHHPVIVLDGDGSLLMNLSSLVTVAEAAPANLIHFVVENGTYEANGGHPIPGRGQVDFAALARAAGYRDARGFDGINRFASELPGLLGAAGPVFAALRVEAGDAPPLEYDYGWLHSPDRRREFRAAIQPILRAAPANGGQPRLRPSRSANSK